MNIHVFTDLVKKHEAAHVAHAEAVRAYKEHNNTVTKEDMLYLGASASYTSGKLEGFVLGLIAILEPSKES